MDHTAKFGPLSLYEQRINRTVHKNMALLRRMQTERKKAAEAVRHSSVPKTLRPTLVSNLRTHATGNGFVFANNEFASPRAPEPPRTFAAA
jgi:hypothetical protein